MPEVIDKIHFKDLAERDPRDVCRRAICSYDEATARFELDVWGEAYEIYPADGRIVPAENADWRLHGYLQLFILHYLLGAKEIEPAGEWISEKDIPGGTTFFRGPHAIPTPLISHRFKNDIDAFSNRCEQLRGKPIEMADAAFAFRIAPRIRVAVLHWQGDDDFPAESKILYDRTVSEHLASDIIFALAVGICHRLAQSSNV